MTGKDACPNGLVNIRKKSPCCETYARCYTAHRVRQSGTEGGKVVDRNDMAVPARDEKISLIAWRRANLG